MRYIQVPASDVDENPVSTLGWQPAVTQRLDSFGQWADFVRENFPWLEFKNKAGGDFGAEISAHNFGGSELSMIQSTAGEVIRTKRLSDSSDEGFIKLMWQFRGSLSLEQNRSSCILKPGQLTVCDTSRPYKIEMSDQAKFAVLMMPHSFCPGWEHISELVCASQIKKSASARAILGTLMAYAAADREAHEDDLETVVDAVQLMASKVLHNSAEGKGITSYEDPRFYKVRAHIVENLGNSEFGPDQLASAMCMSRRSLYMLFEECNTTPVKLIRDIRLEAAMRILADKTQKKRKITDVAFDTGFGDYATFCRLFKSQYGKTPSEFKNSGQVNILMPK